MADLLALDRENDRLELRVALVKQSLATASAHLAAADADAQVEHHVAYYLDRAGRQMRRAG